MRGGRVLEMVALVHDEPGVRGEHRRFLPVVRRAPYGDVGHEKMMIDDDDIGLRRLATRLVEKALLVQWALEPPAQIGLRRDLVPELRPRRRRQIAQRAVARSVGPGGDRVELVPETVVEECRGHRRRLLEPLEAEIISPALEQCIADRLVAEGSGEKWQVLPDELLLQIDGVRGDDRALAIGGRPAQRGYEVAERLADTRSRLEQPDPALVVEARDRHRHLTLAGT